ncbi:MAG: virulence factor TspB C-terminal domain-related protein [Pseudomonadota bacterium]
MAHIYRLVAVLVLLFSTGTANAAGLWSSQLVGICQSSSGMVTFQGVGTAAQLASQLAAYLTPRCFANGGYTAATSNETTGQFCIFDVAPAATYCYQATPHELTCTPPKVPNAAQTECVDPSNECPKAGVSAGEYKGPGRAGEKSLCSSEFSSGDPNTPYCRIKGFAQGSFGGQPGGSPDGGWLWAAVMTHTGEACASVSGGPNSGDPVGNGLTCTFPAVKAVVNGVETCYTPNPGEGPPTESAAQGGAVNNTNPDGTGNHRATTATTTCTAGVCTTVVTNTNTPISIGGVAGTPVVTRTETTCNQGPGCGPVAPTPATTVTNTGDGTTTTTTTGATGSNGGTAGGGSGGSGGGSSMFTGSCSTGFQCDGDAVMCAMARLQYATNCKMVEDYTDPRLQQVLTDMEKVGDRTGELPNSSKTVLTAASFDSTDAFGGAGGCIQDMTVNVVGTSVTIPLSRVCSSLEMLGNVLLMVSFLLAARIVARG